MRETRQEAEEGPTWQPEPLCPPTSPQKTHKDVLEGHPLVISAAPFSVLSGGRDEEKEVLVFFQFKGTLEITNEFLLLYYQWGDSKLRLRLFSPVRSHVFSP